MVIKYPTVSELNNGLDFSARSKQEPKERPLTPQEERIRAYYFVREVESGSFPDEKRVGAKGDAGAALGDMQMWETYYTDAKSNRGRIIHKRPWHLTSYEQLGKKLHAGAETFAEYQRRHNPKGWIAGDLDSIALTHHLGGTQYRAYLRGDATADTLKRIPIYRQHLKSIKEGGRIPKDYFAPDRWRQAPQGAKPLTKLNPTQEKDFQNWFKSWSAITEQSRNPDDPLHYYDYRAFFKAGMAGQGPTHPTWNDELKQWKWESKYKRKGHPAFYVRDKSGKMINTKTGKPILDWFSHKTLEAINPKEAEKFSIRLRDNPNIWDWKE